MRVRCSKLGVQGLLCVVWGLRLGGWKSGASSPPPSAAASPSSSSPALRVGRLRVCLLKQGRDTLLLTTVLMQNIHLEFSPCVIVDMIRIDDKTQWGRDRTRR